MTLASIILKGLLIFLGGLFLYAGFIGIKHKRMLLGNRSLLNLSLGGDIYPKGKRAIYYGILYSILRIILIFGALLIDFGL